MSFNFVKKPLWIYKIIFYGPIQYSTKEVLNQNYFFHWVLYTSQLHWFPPKWFSHYPTFCQYSFAFFFYNCEFFVEPTSGQWERRGVKFNNILISITFCFTIRLMLWHPMSLGRWGELQYLYNWGLDEGACNSMVSPQWADSVCHQFHQLQHCVHCHCWWGGVSTSLVLSHHPCHPPSPHISWN